MQAKTVRTRRGKGKAIDADGCTPTWEIAHIFPAQGTWTEEEYLALDEIHDRFPLVELSNGFLEVLPWPTQTHQFILINLFELLRAFVSEHMPGMVLFSGMRIRLGKGNFRDPDIVYMKAEHAHRRHERWWDGADLVMEVVSGTRKDRERDWTVKVREYAAARIPEYWIIDPKRRLIRVLRLRGKAYKLHGDFGPGTQATSVLLPGFAVAVSEVLAAGNEQGG